MSQEAVALGHRWFEEVWNKGRVSAIDELMTSECRVCGLGDDDSQASRTKAPATTRVCRAGVPQVRSTRLAVVPDVSLVPCLAVMP